MQKRSLNDQAAQRYLDFQLGWFAEPIYGASGDYPPSMRQRLRYQLPQLSEEEKALLRGSADFFGLNHYTTQ